MEAPAIPSLQHDQGLSPEDQEGGRRLGKGLPVAQVTQVETVRPVFDEGVGVLPCHSPEALGVS